MLSRPNTAALNAPLKLSEAAVLLGIDDPAVIVNLVRWGTLESTRAPDGSYRTTRRWVNDYAASRHAAGQLDWVGLDDEDDS